MTSWNKGLLGGVGLFMGSSVMFYFCWPMMQNNSINKGSIVATNVLSDKAVKDQAVVLTKDIVKDILNDDETLLLLSNLLKKLLKEDTTKQDLISLLQDVWVSEKLDTIVLNLGLRLLRDEEIKAEAKKFLLDATLNTVAEESFHKGIAESAKKSCWSLVF